MYDRILKFKQDLLKRQLLLGFGFIISERNVLPACHPNGEYRNYLSFLKHVFPLNSIPSVCFQRVFKVMRICHFRSNLLITDLF